MRKLITPIFALSLLAGGAAAFAQQTNQDTAAQDAHDTHVQEKADKAQAKADKAEYKADKSHKVKKAAKKQDKADRKEAEVPPPPPPQ